MIEKNVVIVFAKEPIAGKVKTRLGKTIGMEKAAELYDLLLKRTLGILSNISHLEVILFKTSDSSEKYFQEAGYTKILNQADGDLGERMKNAFNIAFHNGAQRVVIVGTDCPDLGENDIKKAFVTLKEHDVVVGPALDGGYYLLGLKAEKPDLFRDIKWSTGEVLKETMQRIEGGKLSYSTLEEKFDIDEAGDLEKIKDSNFKEILDNIVK